MHRLTTQRCGIPEIRSLRSITTGLSDKRKTSHVCRISPSYPYWPQSKSRSVTFWRILCVKRPKITDIMSHLPEFSNMSTNNSSGNFSIVQRAFFRQYYSHFIASIIIGNAICLFALASNIICLIAICTQPRLRQQGNALVANLIMVNILLSLFVYPISIVSPMYRQYYELASNFCNWIFFYYFMVQAFVWHECLLAFNRFVAILILHYIRTFPVRNVSRSRSSWVTWYHSWSTLTVCRVILASSCLPCPLDRASSGMKSAFYFCCFIQFWACTYRLVSLDWGIL